MNGGFGAASPPRLLVYGSGLCDLETAQTARRTATASVSSRGASTRATAATTVRALRLQPGRHLRRSEPDSRGRGSCARRRCARGDDTGRAEYAQRRGVHLVPEGAALLEHAHRGEPPEERGVVRGGDRGRSRPPWPAAATYRPRWPRRSTPVWARRARRWTGWSGADARAADLAWLAVRPVFDGLRSESRFASLVARIGV
jgi:hypothetical protein